MSPSLWCFSWILCSTHQWVLPWTPSYLMAMVASSIMYHTTQAWWKVDGLLTVSTEKYTFPRSPTTHVLLCLIGHIPNKCILGVVLFSGSVSLTRPKIPWRWSLSYSSSIPSSWHTYFVLSKCLLNRIDANFCVFSFILPKYFLQCICGFTCKNIPFWHTLFSLLFYQT